MGKHDINAFLGAGTCFSGRLTFEGVVRIDGSFEGEITSPGTLIVGKQAKISGKIDVGRLFCGGDVSADVVAAAQVAIHGTGRLTGTVRTPSLLVEEGGGLNGEVAMGGVPEPVGEPVALHGGEEGQPTA